jgi:hypothetical protein
VKHLDPVTRRVIASHAIAALADAMRRDVIVRVTLVIRATLLLAAAVAVVADHVWLAVAACTLAVAVGTPAYPAQVAAMPGIAGAQRVAAQSRHARPACVGPPR